MAERNISSCVVFLNPWWIAKWHSHGMHSWHTVLCATHLQLLNMAWKYCRPLTKQGKSTFCQNEKNAKNTVFPQSLVCIKSSKFRDVTDQGFIYYQIQPCEKIRKNEHILSFFRQKMDLPGFVRV